MMVAVQELLPICHPWTVGRAEGGVIETKTGTVFRGWIVWGLESVLRSFPVLVPLKHFSNVVSPNHRGD